MSTTRSIVVPLAEGFEETEAVAIVDVLRRAEVEVLLAGLVSKRVRGSHGITLECDVLLDDVDVERLDGIVLPGGQPGSKNLAADERVLSIVRTLHTAGKLVGAVCAAPIVLERAGVLQGARVTSHPSVREQLSSAEVVAAPRVVRTGNIWTSQGPGTTLEFALDLAAELCGADCAAKIEHALLVARPR